VTKRDRQAFARDGFTLVEVLVTFAIVSIFAVLLFSFGSAIVQGKPPQAWLLRTVEYDSHLWVVPISADGAPVHHPDCPCRLQTPERGVSR